MTERILGQISLVNEGRWAPLRTCIVSTLGPVLLVDVENGDLDAQREIEEVLAGFRSQGDAHGGSIPLPVMRGVWEERRLPHRVYAVAHELFAPGRELQVSSNLQDLQVKADDPRVFYRVFWPLAMKEAEVEGVVRAWLRIQGRGPKMPPFDDVLAIYRERWGAPQ